MGLVSTYNNALEEALHKIGGLMVKRMEQYLRDEGKEVTGDLLQSLGYEIGEDEIVFYATAKHGYWVHEGTDPHWPPPGALTNWVQRVGFAPGLSIRSRDYLARKSIAETGTSASPFIREPLERRADDIAKRLEARLINALEDELNG